MPMTVIEGKFGDRPQPASGLTDVQRQIWQATVNSEAAEFFNTNAKLELLRDYCVHKSFARGLEVRLANFDGDDQQLKNLLEMHDRQTKGAADKATKLRLTNQSRYVPATAATAAQRSTAAKKTWEI